MTRLRVMTGIQSIGTNRIIGGPMSDNESNKINLKYDSRLTEYNLRNGILTQDELKAYLDKLPDLSGQTAIVDISDKKHAEDQH